METTVKVGSDTISQSWATRERLEPQFFIFFNVPDLMTAVARVKELGGETDAPGPDEPGFGCTCRDPQGIRFGLHQPPKG